MFKRKVKVANKIISLQVVMPDNPESKFFWEQLARLRINKGLPDPTVAVNAESDHECWMYMYTTDELRRFLWFTWTRYVHVFRHRCHPVTGSEERVAIPVRKGFDFSSLVTTWSNDPGKIEEAIARSLAR